VTSATAGPAVVTAQVSGVGSATLPLVFVAKTPTKIDLQATPSAIPPNTTGTINQSTLLAVVRDSADNLVANQTVTFNIVSDLSRGALSAGTAVTDANGRAQVQFISGATSTPANGVVIQASVGSSVTKTASLTVSGSALFINIGFGNDMGNLDSTTYKKPFSIYVTDANGVPVGNQVVNVSVIPKEYRKGSLTHDGTVWNYSPGSPRVTCPNEDVNRNGILDSTEDTNGNGRLTPGNVAVASPGVLTTDASGRALFDLQYGEQFAIWTTVFINARATVAGTESQAVIEFDLSGISEDFKDAAISPAARVSPFGSSATCADAL
jgi:alpha-tubulin suppressor-like RCC1 family protein